MRHRITTILSAAALLAGISQGYSNTQLTLDPNQPWIGYVNVFNLPSAGGAYQFGSPWGLGALTSYYDTPTAPYNTLTLIANTNTYNPSDPYWVNPDGSGNKTVDASFYVQNDALEGQTLTFSGVCLNNSFISPYTSTVFIKEFNNNYAVINSVTATAVTGQPFSITLATGGGSHIQYGFETIGPDAKPATVYTLGTAVYQVQYPAIAASTMYSQAAVVGQNVTFTQTPTGTGPFRYGWTLNGTPLVNSSHIAGANTNVLTINNAGSGDVGTYAVNITNINNATASASAQLALIPLSSAETNIVVDPSFESDAFTSASQVGWLSYGSCYFDNTNDWWSPSDPSFDPDITTVDGTNILFIYSNGSGSYTGCFQDRPAQPGAVYTASAWFLTPPPDTSVAITNGISCWLDVQFRDINNNILRYCRTTPFTTNYPPNTWIQMPVTNSYDTSFNLISTTPYFIAPAGTAFVRIQPTYYTPDATSYGVVCLDQVVMMVQEPVVTAQPSGANTQLTFTTLYGPTYKVLYKNNLTDASWQDSGQSVVGDGTVKSISLPIGPTTRFYVVNTQP